MGTKEFFAREFTPVRKIYKPFVIAEAEVNHEGNMELDKRLVNETFMVSGREY